MENDIINETNTLKDIIVAVDQVNNIHKDHELTLLELQEISSNSKTSNQHVNRTIKRA